MNAYIAEQVEERYKGGNDMSKKAIATMVALNALRGWFAPIPTDMDISEILQELSNLRDLGGLQLSESAKKIAEKAQRIEGSKITYLAVNVLNGDTMITMLCDIPEQHLTNEKEMFERGGYVFAYVYNNSAPWCSEYGDVVVEKQPGGHIKRVG